MSMANIIASAAVVAALVFSIVNLIGSIGLHRMPDFFARLHMATVIAIGGSAYLCMAIAIYALLSGMTGAGISSLAAAFLLILTAPTGSHVLARAVYRKLYGGSRR